MCTAPARVPLAPVPVTRCPCDTFSILSQLEEQSDQLEKLRRELETKAGELVRVQEALSRTEQVWGYWPGWSGVGRDELGSSFPRTEPRLDAIGLVPSGPRWSWGAALTQHPRDTQEMGSSVSGVGVMKIGP